MAPTLALVLTACATAEMNVALPPLEYICTLNQAPVVLDVDYDAIPKVCTGMANPHPGSRVVGCSTKWPVPLIVAPRIELGRVTRNERFIVIVHECAHQRGWDHSG